MVSRYFHILIEKIQLTYLPAKFFTSKFIVLSIAINFDKYIFNLPFKICLENICRPLFLTVGIVDLSDKYNIKKVNNILKITENCSKVSA